MGQGVLTASPRGLVLGGAEAEELARRFGTPLYVYDAQLIDRRFLAFRRAFSATDTLIAYAVKANGNLSIIRRLAALGAGADVTSAGELHRALKAGVDPRRIVFAGVGKSAYEIELGIEAGILSLNVESGAELQRIEQIARSKGKQARFSVRVNPDVEADTPHEYTRTGRAADKFGVPWPEVEPLLAWARDRPSLKPLGLAMHIGSQITAIEPYVRALDRILVLAGRIRAMGIELEYLDVGGGFGIRYGDEEPLDVLELAAALIPRVSRTGLQLIVEPGRAIVGEAGTLLARVEYVKRSGRKHFVIVDSGMSELIRPSHYGVYHTIELVNPGVSDRSAVEVDIVGPICETGDFLARGRRMPRLPSAGELLAIRTVGAYGFAMSSNYNGRTRPAELLVDRGQARIIRRRETLDDLIRGEEPMDGEWRDFGVASDGFGRSPGPGLRSTRGHR